MYMYIYIFFLFVCFRYVRRPIQPVPREKIILLNFGRKFYSNFAKFIFFKQKFNRFFWSKKTNLEKFDQNFYSKKVNFEKFHPNFPQKAQRNAAERFKFYSNFAKFIFFERKLFSFFWSKKMNFAKFVQFFFSKKANFAKFD